MRLGGRMSAAVDVLKDMDARRRPVAEALKDWGLSHRFAGSGDRAAIGNIVYDILRRRRSLGWRMQDDGAEALVFAAVMEQSGRTAAELLANLDGDRFAPPAPPPGALHEFADRRREDAPDAIAADLPDWLVTPFVSTFGEEWRLEADALCERPPLDLRVNTLKCDRGKAEKALAPLSAEPTSHSPLGLRIAPIAGDGRHPNVTAEAGFQKGWFEIQDEGSQLVSLLSHATSGEQVLDLCAGGGGKTLALAASMGNGGQIHATDSDRRRLAPIHERLKRADIRNVQVRDPRDDTSDLQGRMDLVLVDAPCTGTGTWRRRPDAKWRLNERQLERRMAEQDAVLDQAAAFVKPGGRLVYVTCSLLPAENIDRVTAFLDRQSGRFDVSNGLDVWQLALPGVPASFRATTVGAGSALTLSPRTSGTDGFFFCQMVRR